MEELANGAYCSGAESDVTIFLLFHLHMSSSRWTVASPSFHFVVSIDSAVCFTFMLFTFTCLLLAFRRMYFIHATYMFTFYLSITCSDVPAPAWPESPGFGLALGGLGFVKSQAGPKAKILARPGLALA